MRNCRQSFHRARTVWSRPFWRSLSALLWLAALCAAAATTATVAATATTKEPPSFVRPASITVTLDDNYPPFIFRNASGEVQGVLVDSWALWQKHTGINVNLKAMDWAKAQELMRSGQADVIDTIFVNETRMRIYDFSAPYAKIDVPIFFHESIGGIVNADSLKGFTVGVKDGDACIDVLQARGIDSLKTYPSYSAVITAAGAGDVRVFCVDQPPAVYFLHQLGLAKSFRQSVPLYSGEFHRAVRKGNTNLLKLVEDGFAKLPRSEMKAIEQKWYGAEVQLPGLNRYAGYAGYFLLGVLLLTMALIGWNVTLRRRVEQKTTELAGERDFATRIINAIGQGLTVTDREGRFEFVNPTYARLLGCQAADLIGRKPEDVAADNDSQIYELQRAARRAGHTSTYESRLRRADGSIIDVSITAAPRREDGEYIGSIAVITDRTELNRAEAARLSLEAQLRESQKMQAIGTLAGGIAHDFNNILAAILGNAKLALQDASGNPDIVRSLEEIRKAGTRGRDLVQQILSFSRRQPTEMKPVTIGLILDESAKLLRATLPARLTLAVDCAPDLPTVMADKTQIQQVLINLVTNAMQAMPSGAGRIDICANSVILDPATVGTHASLNALSAEHPGQTVRLMVRDNGPGMNAEIVARIFEPFFTTKPVNEGTGLGLSVVLGIVESHGGAIVVDSAPGAGTTFTVYLPAAAAAGIDQMQPAQINANAAIDAAPPALVLDNSPRILYLDDDESMVSLVNRLLERRGYRVSAFTDQMEALAALASDPASFNLVVTDFNMPGMSGLDVARAVRAIRSDLPVAIVSGFIDEQLRAEAEQAGVRELIFKANLAEEFCDAVARLV